MNALPSCLRFSFALLTLSGCGLALGLGDFEDGPPGASGSDSTGSGAGIACASDNACANGTCVDGFCCDTACEGTCEACNVKGHEGQCVAVTGKPTHGSCGGNESGVCAGTCDGKERAACTYPETECGTGSCAGGTATLAPKCKQGSCATPTTQACALGCFEDGCLGVKQVAAGYYTTCAVLTDKKVRCWGNNTGGQTGQDLSIGVVKTPTELPSLQNVEAIAATFGSMCAVLADKTVKCWGGNTSGELGQGTVDTTGHPIPVSIKDLAGVTFLGGSSGGHYCAIVEGGTVKCWGGNSSGELGDGSSGNSKSTPVTVCSPETSPCAPSRGATFVAGGDNHTCAVFEGNRVACWGNNSVGQSGQDSVGGIQPIPRFVPGLTATYLTAGNQLTCAASEGKAKCWGGNGAGRLGNGKDEGSMPMPESVCTKQDCSTLLTGVTAVTTYDESSCALSNGAVKCWGINTGGQLGDGNASASQNYAATTAIGSGVVAIASGGGVNLAIVIDGANRDLRCWGNEGSNQCGDGGTSMARKTPIAPKW